MRLSVLIKLSKLFFLAVCLFSISAINVPKVEAVTVAELQAQIAALQRQLSILTSSQDISGRLTQNLAFGMRDNAQVRILQNFLVAKNMLSTAAVTGNFYIMTQRAVRAYQASQGITPSGYVGPLTRQRINAELDFMARPAIPPSTPPVPPVSVIPPSSASQPDVKVIDTPDPIPVPQPIDGTKVEPKSTYLFDTLSRLVQDHVNQERANYGVPRLNWDVGLAQMARFHSEDQAADNKEITNPDIICHYPIIRHEGIRGGYSLAERLQNAQVQYRTAAENIVMFSTAKNLLYMADPNNPPKPCPEIPSFPTGTGTREERLDFYAQILSQSRAAVFDQPKVNWVNREWMTNDEIARRAVELWMNSPGHRENVLRGVLNYGGIGIAGVNDYLIITHNFAGR